MKKGILIVLFALTYFAPLQRSAFAQQNEIVYVAGVLDDRATLWRNGVAQTLSNSDSRANSVFVVTQR